MAACATVLVKEGKVEKVVNLSDYEDDQRGDKKLTLVSTPEVSIDEDALNVTRLPASSGEHARIVTEAYRRGVAAGEAAQVASMANVGAAPADEEADVLEVVVDSTHAPKDLPSVPTVEELKAQAETVNAQTQAAIEQAQADGKANKGKAGK